MTDQSKTFFKLRLPVGLMTTIKQQACAQHRSITSEIVHQLVTAYGKQNGDEKPAAV